jgi:hypothetical protein
VKRSEKVSQIWINKYEENVRMGMFLSKVKRRSVPVTGRGGL